MSLAPGPAVTMQSDSDPNGMDQDELNPDAMDQDEDHLAVNTLNIAAGAAEPSQAMQQEQSQQQQQEEQDIFKLVETMEDEDEIESLMIQHLLKKSQLNEGTQSLSLQQKEELQRGIQCLESDYFDPLIGMLQRFIPEGEGDDDEVELDVDQIDDPLQVKMYNYMVKAIRQQEDSRQVREGGGAAVHNGVHDGVHDGDRGVEVEHVVEHNDHSIDHSINQSHDTQSIDQSMDHNVHSNDPGHTTLGSSSNPANQHNEDVQDMNAVNSVNAANAMDVDQGHPEESSMENANAVNGVAQNEQNGGMDVERTEQSNSVGPNVVNAFPTTMPSNTENMQNGGDQQENGMGDGQFEFGASDENNRDSEAQEDGDVEMNGDGVNNENGTNEVQQHEEGGDDVLGDIANAVESGATGEIAADSMIAVESNTNDPDNGDNENQNEEDSETVAQPVIIPTMPELHRDDNATDSVQSAVNNDDAETPTADNADGQTLTPQKAITPQKDEIVMHDEKQVEDAVHGVNVDMDMVQQQQEQEMEQQPVGDDEDVDTPLADEIDF